MVVVRSPTIEKTRASSSCQHICAIFPTFYDPVGAALSRPCIFRLPLRPFHHSVFAPHRLFHLAPTCRSLCLRSGNDSGAICAVSVESASGKCSTAKRLHLELFTEPRQDFDILTNLFAYTGDICLQLDSRLLCKAPACAPWQSLRPCVLCGATHAAHQSNRDKLRGSRKSVALSVISWWKIITEVVLENILASQWSGNVQLAQEEPPDIPAWNIWWATQRLSEDESFGNTRGTLTRHPMNISQVYRECSRHGASTKHSFGGT